MNRQGGLCPCERTERRLTERRYDAVVFDLLTALIDFWTLWNAVAGSEVDGLRWRRKYLDLTYGQGAYRPYEDIVRAAAEQSGVGPHCADELVRRWDELPPWPETVPVLGKLARYAPLGVATNCSIELGRRAAARCGAPFAAMVTAEEAGFYSRGPSPIARCLLGLARPRNARCSWQARRRMCPAPKAPECRSIGTIAWRLRRSATPCLITPNVR